MLDYSMKVILKSPLLTICIPTYNRSQLLNVALTKLIDLVKVHQIRVLVSDDGSVDDTGEVVAAHQQTYPHLMYYRQPHNVGYDRNVASCYEQVDSAYVWILGDTYEFVPGLFEAVLEQLKTGNYHGIVVNSNSRIKGIPSTTYQDPTAILADLGWHMTMLCSFVMATSLIQSTVVNRYLDTVFVHFGVFFESIVTVEALHVGWVADNVVGALQYDPTSGIPGKRQWNTLSVFGMHWFGVVMSLPNQLDLAAKLKCLRDHDARTHVFNTDRLLAQRISHEITYSQYVSTKPVLPFVTTKPTWKIKAYLIMPETLVHLIRAVRQRRQRKR